MNKTLQTEIAFTADNEGITIKKDMCGDRQAIRIGSIQLLFSALAAMPPTVRVVEEAKDLNVQFTSSGEVVVY